MLNYHTIKNCLISKVQSVLLIIAVLAFSQQAIANTTKNRPADKLLHEFSQLMQGQFDNYNQVNFETNGFLDEQDLPKDKHHRLYKQVTKLDSPKLGEFVFYEQTHAGGRDKPIYRKSISVVTPNHDNQSLILTSYKLKQDLDVIANQSTLDLAQLSPLGESCQTRFVKVGTSFVGTLDENTCLVDSKHGGKVKISGDFVISEQGYWHLEAGYHASSNKMLFGRVDKDYYKLTRAKQFKCWAAFKTDQTKDNGEPKWDFFQNIYLHNQGDIAEFTTTESTPKHYFVRLKETIFPSGKRPDVLEIFVHDNSEKAQKDYKQALSYTWTNSDAKRLGLNLRWMQTSCHQVEK